jgi:ABC-2 type transport system ATP-binding protein
MSSPSVSVESVTKRFSGHTAVNSLSMEVSAGGIFGLLGPNGAGKSTTIRLIMGILEPDQGKVSLFGSSEGSRKLSARIGYLPEERGLYKKMKVLDHLVFLGETKGISRSDARRRAQTWLERLGVADWALKKVEDLSKGMQQKVQFAGALLHEPDLVILDEPFSGLDPVNAQVMKDIVVDIAKEGRTVLFSTHVMEQAERMCDRIAIIARGETVVSGTVAQVKADFGGRHVALGFSHDKQRAEQIFADRSLIARVDDYGASAELQMADGADPEQLLASLVREGVGLRRFEVVEPSLHAIFIAKVGPDAATAHAGVAA